MILNYGQAFKILMFQTNLFIAKPIGRTLLQKKTAAQVSDVAYDFLLVSMRWNSSV